jgi:hypothetical protein
MPRAAMPGGAMMKEFARSGISLKYPVIWSLESEDSEDGWTTSIFSPGSAFLVVNLIDDGDDPQVLVDQILESLTQEYEKLEAEAVVDTVAGQPAVGHDMQFFLYDLTNTAWTRCVIVPGGCLLILAQSTDDEMDTHGVILDEIIASITIED